MLLGGNLDFNTTNFNYEKNLLNLIDKSRITS